MRIEAAKERAALLPVNPTYLHLYVRQPSYIRHIFPGRERDEYEVKGYYAALAQSEQYAAQNHSLTEKVIQTLHPLVMSDGTTRIKPTSYPDRQNVIKDGATGTIVYMPPEAKGVPGLMRKLVSEVSQ